MEDRVALSINEAATRAGICVNTLRKFIASGDLIARRVDRRVLITVHDLRAWLDGQPAVKAAAS